MSGGYGEQPVIFYLANMRPFTTGIGQRTTTINERKRIKMDYLFVYSNGWYLKIDNVEKLLDYHEKMGGSQFEGALLMYLREGNPNKLPPEERIKRTGTKDYMYLQAAIIQAKKINGTILDGFRCLNIEIGFNQLHTLRKYGALYINKVGGHTFSLEYTQFYRRKELIFPDFTTSDIRIKQQPYGKHYYAYIGDMQVRGKDQIKWDTYDKAMEAALQLFN